METKKYVRNPVYVDAIQVTGQNMREIASWCNGSIQTVGDKVKAEFIKLDVKRPLGDRQTKAFIGDWVLSTDSGFKVYTPKAFKNSFSEHIVYTEADALAQLDEEPASEEMKELADKTLKAFEEPDEELDIIAREIEEAKA